MLSHPEPWARRSLELSQNSYILYPLLFSVSHVGHKSQSQLQGCLYALAGQSQEAAELFQQALKLQRRSKQSKEHLHMMHEAISLLPDDWCSQVCITISCTVTQALTHEALQPPISPASSYASSSIAWSGSMHCDVRSLCSHAVAATSSMLRSKCHLFLTTASSTKV